MIRTSKRPAVSFVETLGSPALKKKSEPVTEFDAALQKLAEHMLDDMEKFNGIGLAAPQVGRNLRMIVVGVPLDSMSAPASPGEMLLLPRMPLILLNPEIIESSEETAEREEGCLSVPGIWAKVVRPRFVKFRATLPDGEKIECDCDGLLARCLQHEIDHLNGITFIDRLSPQEYAKVEVKVKNLRREGGRSNYRRTV